MFNSVVAAFISLPNVTNKYGEYAGGCCQ